LSAEGSRFRATVQASSEVAGRGTVAVVAVEAGELKVGDRVHVLGVPDTVADVIGVEVFAADDPEEVANPVQQLGLLLTGVGKEDLPRASVLEFHPAAEAPGA
jgi:translation elongation factor EF-Tu-like GTPase